MTATTRSASMTPSSMSLASSEASLTLCSGILRTSIGAGTAASSLRWPPPGYRPDLARGGKEGVRSLVGGKDGADVVARDGVGDVLEGRDDGAGAAPLHEAERGPDLGGHRAVGELAGRGVCPQFRLGDPAQRTGGGGAVPDQHLGDVG